MEEGVYYFDKTDRYMAFCRFENKRAILFRVVAGENGYLSTLCGCPGSFFLIHNPIEELTEEGIVDGDEKAKKVAGLEKIFYPAN